MKSVTFQGVASDAFLKQSSKAAELIAEFQTKEIQRLKRLGYTDIRIVHDSIIATAPKEKKRGL